MIELNLAIATGLGALLAGGLVPIRRAGGAPPLMQRRP